jgi:hypothetical protein
VRDSGPGKVLFMQRRIACVVLLCVLPCLVSAGDSSGARGKAASASPKLDKPSALLASGSGGLVPFVNSYMTNGFSFSSSPTATCGTTSDGESYAYDAIAFTSDVNANVTLTYSGDCAGTTGLGNPLTNLSLHRAPFDPANKCANFLGGLTGNTATPLTVDVPASTSMVMVISGFIPATDTNCNYTYALNSTPAVPTMNEWGLIGLCVVLMSAGVWVVRRRRVSANG